jgi:hypothetical protein
MSWPTFHVRFLEYTYDFIDSRVASGLLSKDIQVMLFVNVCYGGLQLLFSTVGMEDFTKICLSQHEVEGGKRGFRLQRHTQLATDQTKGRFSFYVAANLGTGWDQWMVLLQGAMLLDLARTPSLGILTAFNNGMKQLQLGLNGFPLGSTGWTGLVGPNLLKLEDGYKPMRLAESWMKLGPLNAFLRRYGSSTDEAAKEAKSRLMCDMEVTKCIPRDAQMFFLSGVGPWVNGDKLKTGRKKGQVVNENGEDVCQIAGCKVHHEAYNHIVLMSYVK